jgi:hypothetical protein
MNAQQIWQKLSDVPVNEENEIDEPFLDFPVGTHRQEIWSWIERAYEVNVYDLMYPQSLSQWLSDVTVSEKADHVPDSVAWWPDGLPWGVTDPDRGVCALFQTKRQALHYRLSLINNILNPEGGE